MSTGTEITLVIDGKNVDFVRKDSIQPASPIMGDKRIIVAGRGWVFVGSCEDHDDGSVTIRSAKNIRRWGTTKGLAELANGPTPKTVIDDGGTVRCTPIVAIAVISGW